MKSYSSKSATLFACMLIAMACFVIPFPATGQHNKPDKGYRSVNGINMYYEIAGTGKPLLLLHGGLGSTGMFTPILPQLTKTRQVIMVDLYGHGRTALTGRPTTMTELTDDVASLLRQLGYDKVDVAGYSMGGGVGLRLAIQHPGLLNKLVVLSAGFARDGFYSEILALQEQMNAGTAEFLKQTPIYKAYTAVAPRPEDFPKLIEANANMMRIPYNWSEEVKRLKMPVMLVYGDADMIRPEHIVQFYQLLGGGLKDAGWNREHMPQNRLAILPNKTHYEVFMAPEMVQAILPFLDGDAH